MKWIKVSERLPEKSHNYFVRARTKYQGYDHNDTAFFRPIDKSWEFGLPDNGRFVTEWLDEAKSTATQALKQIEQFSDCGDYAMAIVRMKAIASEALKSESIPSEVEEDELWELTKKKLLDLTLVHGKIKKVIKVMSSVAIVFESGSAYWLRLEKQAEVSLD